LDLRSDQVGAILATKIAGRTTVKASLAIILNCEDLEAIVIASIEISAEFSVGVSNQIQ
jgi:hypothetical protein